MNKAYIFVFDRKPTVDYNLLHKAIDSDTLIKDWWHFIPTTYILISSLTPDQLTRKFQKYLPSNNFLIVQLFPGAEKRQGMLPKDAWTWIKDNIG